MQILIQQPVSLGKCESTLWQCLRHIYNNHSSNFFLFFFGGDFSSLSDIKNSSATHKKDFCEQKPKLPDFEEKNYEIVFRQYVLVGCLIHGEAPDTFGMEK